MANLNVLNSFLETILHTIELDLNPATFNDEQICKKRKLTKNYEKFSKIFQDKVAVKRLQPNESCSDTNSADDKDVQECYPNSDIACILTSSSLSSWEKNIFKDILDVISSQKTNMDSHMIRNHSFVHSLWQKLYTGHWSEVSVSLRKAFTWGSLTLTWFLLKELREKMINKVLRNDLLRIIQVCDRGLLMGQPLVENPLREVASYLNEIIMNPFEEITFQRVYDSDYVDYVPYEAKSFLSMTCLETQHLPSLENFLNYMEKQNPVKLLGVADAWPALQKWDFNYFRKIGGARTVPVEIGSRYTDANWSQSLMFLDQYLALCELLPTGKQMYLAQHQLFDQIPELLRDIIVPDYCHIGEKTPVLNAWIGPKGTVTPLHHDPDHNIFVQVYGYKVIVVFPACDTKYLYPFEDDMLSNTSQVNLELLSVGQDDPLERWPLLQRARGRYVLLGPGESLYLPPKWWHYVRALTGSISVSFWWR